MSFTNGTRRDLRLAIGARSVSLLGDEVATFALVLRLRPFGPWAVAAVLVANLVPIVVLSGVVGRIVDRVDNRRLLACPAAAQVAVCLALAAVGSPVGSVLLVGALGVGQAVTGATWQALLPSLVAPAEVGRALGLAQAGSTLAMVAAPGGAGLLVAAFGTHLPLLVDAGSFVVVAFAARAVSTGRVATSGAAREPGGGWSIVRGQPVLRSVICLLGMFVLLGSMVNVVEVFLVRDVLHADVVWFGLVGTTFAVGMLGGALAGGRMREHRRSFLASALVLGLGLIASGLSPNVPWLLAAGMLTGCANGVLNVSTSALIAAATSEDVRGRVAGVLGATVAGAQLVAFVSGGLLAEALSPRTIFVVGGAAGLCAPLLLGRSLPREGPHPVGRAGRAAGSGLRLPVVRERRQRGEIGQGTAGVRAGRRRLRRTSRGARAWRARGGPGSGRRGRARSRG